MQRKEYPDGSVYEGVLVDDKRHGEGKYTYADDDLYEGAWADGKRHGEGKYTYADGELYEGAWADGKRHGQGKRTCADGDVYEGAWVDGKWHGQGKYTYANGGVYEGAWADAKWHGLGKYTFADGVVYEGAWVDDKRHGQGKYTNRDGDVWRGVCDMGMPTLEEMRAATQLPVAAPVAHGAEEEIDDDLQLGDDPNEAMVHACFEVDPNARAWLSVSRDMLPVMRGADYELGHTCLGILLARVFKQELKSGTVKRKQGGKVGTRYSGLKIKDDATVA